MTKLIVTVEWRPGGMCQTYCKYTEIPLADLQPGQAVAYADPSELFSAITVDEADSRHVALTYRGRQTTLDAAHKYSDLATAGKDYTAFMLSVRLDCPTD